MNVALYCERANVIDARGVGLRGRRDLYGTAGACDRRRRQSGVKG